MQVRRITTRVALGSNPHEHHPGIELIDIMQAPRPETIISELAVIERALLFRLGNGTDSTGIAITSATVHRMIIKDLIERDSTASQLVLTGLGRIVLALLLKRAGINGPSVH